MALDFSIAGSFVNHGSAANLDDLTTFTIWAWVYRTADGSNQMIVTKYSGYPDGFYFFVDNTDGEGQLRLLVFRTADFSLRTDYIASIGDVPPNAWTFVAVTYDNAATPKGKLYKGSLTSAVSEVTYTRSMNGTGAASSNAGASLYVGGVQDDPALVFKGRIAQGGLISAVLSLASIEAIRKASLTNSNVANTKLLFNYTATGTQTDFSGTGNTGTSAVATVAAHPEFFSITNTALPPVAPGASYNQTIGVIRGTAPFTSATVTPGTLPSGLSIALENTQGGEIAARITGTGPGTLGTSTFTINLADTDGAVATKQLSITVAAADTTAPTVPANLAATIISSTQINLAWNPSTDVGGGVTGYDLQRATDAAFTQNLVTFNLGNVTVYNDTGRTPSTQYFYKVRAHDAVPNNSLYSSTVSATTSATETLLTVNNALTYQTLKGFGAAWISNQYGRITEYDTVPDAQGRTGETRDNLTTAQRDSAIEKAFNQVKINFGNVEQQIYQATTTYDYRELNHFWTKLINPALVYNADLDPMLAGSIDLRGGFPFLNSARTANYANYLVVAGAFTVSWANQWLTKSGKAKTDPITIWLFNEPLNGNTELAGGTVQEVIDLIKSCGNALVADGYTNAKFVVPNNGDEDSNYSIAGAIMADAAAKAFVRAIGYHPYPYNQGYASTSNILATSGSGNPESAKITIRNQLRDLGAANGLPVWMTEVSNGHFDNNVNTAFGLIGALRARVIHIHDEFLYANAAAFSGIQLIWDKISHIAHFEDGGAGFYQEGDSIILVDQSLSPGSQVLIGDCGYAIGHYARWMEPGAVRVSATSPDNLIQISAFKKDGKHSFVLINNNTTAKSVRVQLSGSDTFTSTLEGETSYLTNRWLAITPPPILLQNSFIISLPAQSVTSVSNINTVEPPPDTTPVSAFSQSTVFGNAPLTVDFMDLSTNSPTAWSWNFGDGTGSTNQNPSHVFLTPGIFIVTLIASNSGGSSNTASAYIYVSSFPIPAITGIPYSRFYAHPIDWKAITVSHEYEDGGRSFNEVSSTAPRRWDIEFNGLTPIEADIFEQFFNSYRLAKKFAFTDKAGEIFQNVQIEAFEVSHEAHKSWVKNISFRLVRFP